MNLTDPHWFAAGLADARRTMSDAERRAAIPERPVHWPWLHGPVPPRSAYYLESAIRQRALRGLRPDLVLLDDEPFDPDREDPK